MTKYKKSKNLTNSFNNALNGIIYAIKNERNMKIHFIAAISVLILSIYLDLTAIEIAIVCITIGLVIICELFNTAIELILDTFTEEYNLNVKIIKDISAGAVLLSAFTSLLVAYFIFFKKVSYCLEFGIVQLKQAPIHIAIISLIITIFAVLIIKVVFKKGTPLMGGMPSGHAAIAFSATTAIALWTVNTDITVLSLIVSFLVVQSRHQTNVHDWLELFIGSILGILITLIMFQIF